MGEYITDQEIIEDLKTKVKNLEVINQELDWQLTITKNAGRIQLMWYALNDCMKLLDAIPTRLQDHSDPTIARIGKIVNDEGLYAFVRDTIEHAKSNIEFPQLTLKQENDLLKIKLMNVLNDLAVWKASEKRLRREMENNE